MNFDIQYYMYLFLNILYFIIAINCNIWDNLFSKTREIPLVKISSDFNTQFQVQRGGRNYTVTIDYNVKKQLINFGVDTKIDWIFYQSIVNIIEGQIDIKKQTAFYNMKIKCKNYQYSKRNITKNLILSQNIGERQPKIVELLNLFFEYKYQKNSSYYFQLSPDLLSQLNTDYIPEIMIQTDNIGQVIGLIINGRKQSFKKESKNVVLINTCDEPYQQLDINFLKSLVDELPISGDKFDELKEFYKKFP